MHFIQGRRRNEAHLTAWVKSLFYDKFDQYMRDKLFEGNEGHARDHRRYDTQKDKQRHHDIDASTNL